MFYTFFLRLYALFYIFMNDFCTNDYIFMNECLHNQQLYITQLCITLLCVMQVCCRMFTVIPLCQRSFAFGNAVASDAAWRHKGDACLRSPRWGLCTLGLTQQP